MKIDSKLNNSQTCKSVTWIDNNHLLLVIGGAAGSANHGGDLYTYNVQTKEFKLFKNVLKTLVIQK